jgi:hypothetical protein
MSPVNSLDRIQVPAAEPVPTRPRIAVVEPEVVVHRRPAAENVLLALALCGVLTFAGAVAKYVLSPTISTLAPSAAETLDSSAR